MPKKKKAEERDGEKKNNPVKKIKPLAEKLMAVSAAIIISSCTTTFNAKDSDAEHDSGDTPDTEVTEVSGDVPPVDMPVDIINDEISADRHDEEDSIIICEPFNESSTELIMRDEEAIVGGMEIRYEGADSENEGIYSVLCGEELAATETISLSETRGIHLPEYSMTVELTPEIIRDSYTRVAIRVTTH